LFAVVLDVAEGLNMIFYSLLWDFSIDIENILYPDILPRQVQKDQSRCHEHLLWLLKVTFFR